MHALRFVTSAFLQALPTFNLLLGFLLSFLTLAFLMRIILTWYPQVQTNKGFWLFLVWPTEPVLATTRKFIPPIGGVDITPVIWVGLISLMRELLVGQQGVLSQILIRIQSLS